MSTQYRKSSEVPTEVLINRLHELSEAVTKGQDAVRREFTMRVPAELDHDADLVLSEAANRLRELGQVKANLTMGVGTGDGQLFVHGDYDSIKAAQAIVDDRARLRDEVNRLRNWISILHTLTRSFIDTSDDAMSGNEVHVPLISLIREAKNQLHHGESVVLGRQIESVGFSCPTVSQQVVILAKRAGMASTKEFHGNTLFHNVTTDQLIEFALLYQAVNSESGEARKPASIQQLVDREIQYQNSK